MTETILIPPIILWHENEEKQIKKKINATIFSAIDESLSSFGDSVTKAVYSQLEKTYRVKKEDIPVNIEEFVATIEGIFGLGAGLIEMKILQTLHTRTIGFAYFPNGEDLFFKDYVQSVRSFLGSSATL